MAIRTTLLSALVTVAFASSSFAQSETVVDSFARLGEVVEPGNRVVVTDEKGLQTKGKIRELTPASLRLLTGDMDRTETFPSERVARVSKIDSRLNGFLIGLAAGAVPGIWLGLGFKTWCENESGHNCWAAIPYSTGLLALSGGWIGFTIDGAITGQKLVFARSVKF